ncbi:MAG: glucose-1-phosphate adenylyltransferase [Anaerolineaceae bacterium]|nr:glucose-1-phosphate adenylyltransferase [Anaerolineaceae bacterium]
MGSMDDILGVILGGGRGTRLYPLTQERSKPAVPMAGKYRLIDIPISNCINSGIYRIAVLTQFNSVSLHRHISRTYNFDAFHVGWVQIWAAEQTVENTNWYQGTADAVRKQLLEIRSTRMKYVLILAGDHLYRMDFAKMAEFHMQNKADITVAVQPVAASEAGRFGILKRNPDGRIIDFVEKPTDPLVLKQVVSREDPVKPYLGSMGIYLFNVDVLTELLSNPSLDDFGAHVIPNSIKTHTVFGYDFDGFWEDIGTIRSFYETNLMLTEKNPPFNFFDQKFPIYTHPRFLPGSTIEDSILKDVLLAEGCCIEKATITHSVIGLRSQIRCNTIIADSVLMGNDYYEKPGSLEAVNGALEIGEGCEIRGAIIDKNARINKGVVIQPFPKGTNLDGDGWVVRDGIVVIPKSGVIKPGTRIAP